MKYVRRWERRLRLRNSMTTPERTVDEIVEEFANLEHERWSKWQQWVFDCSIENEDGSVTIPKEKVERWKRQIATPYTELTEEEKQSDREQVYPYTQTLQAERQRCEEIAEYITSTDPTPDTETYIDLVKNGNKDDMYDYGVKLMRDMCVEALDTTNN